MTLDVDGSTRNCCGANDANGSDCDTDCEIATSTMYDPEADEVSIFFMNNQPMGLTTPAEDPVEMAFQLAVVMV